VILAEINLTVMQSYRMRQIPKGPALEKQARLSVNLWKNISRKRSIAHSRRELTLDELGRVCEAAHGEMRFMIALGIYCGMRLGDAACLEWSDVDIIKGMISYIPMKTERSQKRVTLPIHQTLHAMLSEVPSIQRSGYVIPELAERYLNINGALSRDVAKLFNSVGIKTTITPGKDTKKGRRRSSKKSITGGTSRAIAECGFHSLRHTFVSLCAAGGVPQSVVQALVGHGSPAMTRHYTHIGLETAQKAVAVLPDLGHAQPAGDLPIATGANLDAVKAMLEGLTLVELKALSQKTLAMIKVKRALPAAVKATET